jgi:hypothetical protein
MATKKKKSSVGKKKTAKSGLKPSKTPGFLKKLREENPMIDYFTRLTILNPAAQRLSPDNQSRREGSFVRLAHAREEFTAPVLTKGKAALSRKREAARRKRNARSDDGE